jgi:hypothetical protein
MASRGETSAKAAQIATLATRRAKERHVEPTTLGADCIARAAALGFGPDKVDALVHEPADLRLDPAAETSIAEHLAAPAA